MKALVLAGGLGQRLRPVTHTSAKQLVPVANKPVLFHILEAVAEADIKDVGIVVGHTEADIRQAVERDCDVDLNITYIRQEAPLGLGHAVLVARDFLGDDDFLMYLGDCFIQGGGLPEMIEEFSRACPAAQVLVTRVLDPTEFGVVQFDATGRVTKLAEKPEKPQSDHAIVGVYLFTPEIHAAVRAIGASPRGELEITHAIQWLIDQGCEVRFTELRHYWRDTGNIKDLLEANRRALESVEPLNAGDVDGRSELVGRVRISEGAVVRNSRVVGPAVIGPGAVLADSYVGPFTSISGDCRLKNSAIESSIVLPGATITGVRRVEGSVIGRHTDIAAASGPAGAHRLVLGDHSMVRIHS